MSDKPSYLGLLNAIAVAETRANCYLSAWIAVTPNPDVKSVLSTVAAREGEHGMSFAKRINELGYSVREKEDPGFDKRLSVAGSDQSDLEKMTSLGLDRLDTGTAPDVFDGVFTDHSIDTRTGELLGRYIAEERDSARLLRSCYEQLAAASNGARRQSPDSDQITALESKVDALCQSVDELRQIVCAPAVTANASS